MRLLFVLDNLGSGGAQIQVLNLLSKLVDQNYSIVVHLYASNNKNQFWDQEFKNLGIPLIYNVKKPGFRLSVIKNLKLTLSRQRFECIISILPYANFYTTLTNIFSLKKIPHISWEMSIHDSHTNLQTRFISFFSSLFSNAIICNSKTQKQNISRLLFRKGSCHFISNGFQISKFNVHPNKNKTRRKNNILLIARLSEAKNAINFVKGVKLFLEECGWCPTIDWIGRVDEGFEYLKYEADQIIKSNKSIQDNWRWLGEVRDVRPYLSTTSCLIIPSKWEGVPNVVCEAMLSKCPVVASAISDLPDILSHNRGILINGTEPEDISFALKKFFSLSEEKVADIVSNAEKFARIEFDRNKMSKKFIEILEKTLIRDDQ